MATTKKRTSKTTKRKVGASKTRTTKKRTSKTTKRTYDVVFNDDYSSNEKGMKASYMECFDYIRAWNGTNHSYFGDYKGGYVSIVCNETGESVYDEEVE